MITSSLPASIWYRSQSINQSILVINWLLDWWQLIKQTTMGRSSVTRLVISFHLLIFTRSRMILHVFTIVILVSTVWSLLKRGLLIGFQISQRSFYFEPIRSNWFDRSIAICCCLRLCLRLNRALFTLFLFTITPLTQHWYTLNDTRSNDSSSSFTVQ